MKSLLSEELTNSLIQQYSHEKFNANFYLVVAGYLKNKGLDNLAKHFVGQHEEEVKHSLQIFDFLTDMNAPFNSVEVDAVSLNINSIIDIANAYLEREEITTSDLIDIKQIAIDENNGVAEEFLRMMIDQQLNELSEASTFMDHSELCGSDWYRVKVWNDSVGG